MEKIRTFIAIEIPLEIHRQIADLQASLRQENAKIPWTKPENIHLTLKFIGDVESSQIEPISAAVRTACQTISPFQISVNEAGCFPNPNNPRVLWVGCKGESETLFTLQKNIENALSDIGFKKEKRKYSAHLTIGRVKSNFGIKPVINKMEASNFEGGSFMVKCVNIMKSVLHPHGAIYTVLSKIDLD